MVCIVYSIELIYIGTGGDDSPTFGNEAVLSLVGCVKSRLMQTIYRQCKSTNSFMDDIAEWAAPVSLLLEVS
jgi:hypothetical protein